MQWLAGRSAWWMLGIVAVVGCQANPPAEPLQHADVMHRAATGADVDPTLFYRELAPLGAWVDHEKLGPVWYPYDTSAGWRPYLNGRWIVTDDAQLLWASAEKFGWATYHYGQWTFLDSHGWVWSPDRAWMPANVQWRRGDGYIGWAPVTQAPASLGDVAMLASDEIIEDAPAATWPATSATTSTTIDEAPSAADAVPHQQILASAWTFVKEDSLLDENARDRAEFVTANASLLERTRPVDASEIVESLAGDAARRKIVDQPTAGMAEIRDEEVAVYRPEIGPRPDSLPPIPILTRQLQPLAADEQRRRQTEYFDQLRVMMDERHEREQAEAKDDSLRNEVIGRQQRERKALADIRQREVEALRRRQRDARETFAVQEAQARSAREKQPPPKPQLIPIPPEWELPPGMIRRD